MEPGLWQTLGNIPPEPMQPLLILRVHTDLRLGLGHVVRALAIQEQWKALGGAACLAVSGDARARRVASGRHPFLDEPLPCEVVDLGEDLQAPLPEPLKARGALVLVDQWECTPEQVQALQPLKVALFEDDGDAHEQADLLFQPYLEGVSFPSSPTRMVEGRKLRPCETRHGNCRVLRGAEYIPVDPAILRLRPKREPEQPLAVHKLLLTFGGTDGPGLAQRAYEVLRRLHAEGGWAGACTLLAPQGISGEPFPGLSIVPSLPGLTQRLQSFDAIWCAMGITLAEAVALGVPVAAWGQNDRQQGMIADVARANGCIDLGVGPEADLAVVAESLAQWLGPEGQETRQELVRDGMALIDGRGAQRVAQELWALAKG